MTTSEPVAVHGRLAGQAKPRGELGKWQRKTCRLKPRQKKACGHHTWKNQTESDTDWKASIYKSVTINTSKEMMGYSDFPIPEDYPNYMHNSKVMDYFRMYTKHFDLLQYIRFKTSVLSIRKCSDFSTTGQWDVVTETDGKQNSAIFDAILVSTGHHIDPYLPLECFPGISQHQDRRLGGESRL
ncbi:solute carrier family 12 member 6 [Platysternon megacephalum]|uniref:Flavin-containing monooxygenase n=1 Tax=Platysternon megacephalum TaxID=55544 RepID=A0A4D9DT76_9SAUR|nr:solute carrier family 12 member 6 [Platysternon megacephalum]